MMTPFDEERRCTPENLRTVSILNGPRHDVPIAGTLFPEFQFLSVLTLCIHDDCLEVRAEVFRYLHTNLIALLLSKVQQNQEDESDQENLIMLRRFPALPKGGM
jgi:hypothetical protein